jgi:hypothetical protein
LMYPVFISPIKRQMCTTVSMKSVIEKLVVGPCFRISASRKENKTRNLPHSLAD